MTNTVFINVDPGDEIYSSLNNKGYLICRLDEKTPAHLNLPENIIHYNGSDPFLFSQVGKKSDKCISTNFNEGALIYGPYHPFRAGRYRLVISGKAVNWSGEEWVDIVVNKGVDEVLHVNLNSIDVGIWQQIYEFELEEDYSDLEVRIWVAKESELTVEDIWIIPVKKFSIGFVVVTYGIVPNLLVDSINSEMDINWYVFHHGSETLNSGIADKFSELSANIFFYCKNRGLAKSWNDGILCSLFNGDDITIVINDDIEFFSGALDLWAKFIISNRNYGVVFLTGETVRDDGISIICPQFYACFSILPKAINSVGAFDEQFIPAYYEDADYTVRLDIAGVSTLIDDRNLCRHKSSSTIRDNPEVFESAPIFVEKNKQLMISKWGGSLPHLKQFTNPYNNFSNSVFIPLIKVFNE